MCITIYAISCGIFRSIFDRIRNKDRFDLWFRNKFPTNQNILAVRDAVPKACAVLLKNYSIIGLIAGTKKPQWKRFNLNDGTRIYCVRCTSITWWCWAHIGSWTVLECSCQRIVLLWDERRLYVASSNEVLMVLMTIYVMCYVCVIFSHILSTCNKLTGTWCLWNYINKQINL